jgi:hypothetical protein
MNNIFLHSNNGVVTDITEKVFRYQVGTYVVPDVTASQDYIYMGSRAPFNHYYFDLTAVSVVASNTITAEYWDGREWVTCYRTIDDTSGFTENGFITFVPNKNKSWNVESTNDGNESVPGLTTINIYDMYWLRIKFSVDIPLGFTFRFIGQKFSDDYDLSSEFQNLVRSQMLLAFGAGKTNWDEQHCKAAEIIVQDLVKSEVIDSSGQILVREEFTLASVQKVAQIIFNSLGDDYIDQRDKAEQEYKNRMNKSIYKVDKNQNGLLDKNESTQRVGFMSR